jgi:ATP-dependent DNA helicase RecG
MAKQQLGLTLDVNLHEEGGKQFLEIPVPSNTVAISLRGRYYYRTGSTKIELTGIEVVKGVMSLSLHCAI